MANEHNIKAKKIVDEDNFFIKKKFSQNFLLDENIINKIIQSANIDKETYVIEIGPGLGALTKHIITTAKKTLIYEVDSDLIPYLEQLLSKKENYKIINQDFLKVNIDKDISDYLDDAGEVVLISNLPYHITTPIIMKVLEESEKVISLTLMMQLEVARRIASKPNSKDYNALSIIIQDQCKTNYLFKVPKTVFKPKPQVDSAVIRLDRKKEVEGFDKVEFYSFVHKAFAQRRKTLVNNLTDAYQNFSKTYFKNLLERNNIVDTIRGEALDLEEFKKIYIEFKKGEEK